MLLAPWAAPSMILGCMLIGDALLYAILPTEAKAFGVSSWEVGVLLASNRLIRLVGMPAIVRVASRRGAGVVLCVAVVVAAVTHLGYATLSGFWALWPMRLGWGLAYAAGNLAMLNAASADPDRVGGRIGLARAASKLPPLLALMATPWLVRSIGIGGVFVGAGLAALLALPLALRMPSEPVEGKARRFGWPTAQDRLLASVALAVDGVLVTCAGGLFAGQGTHGIVAASAVLAVLRFADLTLGPAAGQVCDRWGSALARRTGVGGIVLGLLLIAVGFPHGAALVVLSRPLVTPAIYAQVRRSSAGPSLTAIGRLATWRDVGAAVGPIFALGTLEASGPGVLFGALAGLLIWQWLMPVMYDQFGRIVRLLAFAFFRRVEVEGLENVPDTGGVIVVSWHPNGLIDPGLIVAVMPRPVIFGARHGLFRWPLLGWMMRGAGAVPIYRATDSGTGTEEERRAANRRSLDLLATKVASGGVTCLFPEGDSHDAPHLLSLKTGAARFYYQARQLGVDQPVPVILPVGLHYDAKQQFRSNALVSIHPPLRLPEHLDVTPPADEPDAVARDRSRALTDEIDRALHDVVHATENWDTHRIMHRASKLIRAERAHRVDIELDAPGMVERQFGFARIWAGYYHWLAERPERTGALMARLAEYDADMDALGLEDDELDRAPARGRALGLALLVGQMLAVYLLMPALLVLGSAINIGPYLLLRLVSRAASRKDKDVATIKVLTGALLYPLTWLTAAVLGGVASTWLHQHYEVIPGSPIWAALAVLGFGIVGGIVSLRYLHLVRETTRALRVRLTRARQRVTLARLRVERSELATALEGLEEGLDLPGSVTARGEVISSEQVPPGGRR